MTSRIPTYSICNLNGIDRCVTEFTVAGLRAFVDSHADLVFPHRHHFFQLVLFTESGGEHSIDFQRFEAIKHQLYCMMPGQVHTWDFGPRTDGFVVNFNEPFITPICQDTQFLYDLPMFGGQRNVYQLTETAYREIEASMRAMLHEYSYYTGKFKSDLMRAMLIQLLIYVARSIGTDVPDGVSQRHLATLSEFKKHIELRYRTLRLPKDYAELLHITPNHLNTVCNATVGKSAGEIIRDRVLLEAKRQLVHRSLSISEIGYALDFKDNAYFSRFFKKYTGTTPEEFRKKIAVSAVEL